MSNAIRIVPLTVGHIHSFLAHPIRPEDLLEWNEAGLNPQDDLGRMVQQAAYARAVEEDTTGLKVCVCIWAVSISEGIATLMLIGADRKDLVVPIHQEFSRDEWERIKTLAPILQAYPSVKNKQHLKWLEHFGFKKEGDPLVMGEGKYQRYVFRAAGE